MKVICIVNKKDGSVTYEVEGAVGTKCTDITSVLTAGKQVLKEELKAEYYDQEKRPDFVDNLG